MQNLINGLISGFAVALLAVAFQAVYLPTRVFFIGLAGIYSFAPFVAHSILSYGLGWCLAIGASVTTSIGISLLCEWGNHARLSRNRATAATHLIASLGTYILLVQVASMIWGNDTKTLSRNMDFVTRVGDVLVTGAQWTTFVTAVVLLAGFGLLINRSRLGLRLRAMADNPAQFALYGYNVNYHRLLAFALAGLFGAASALVTANDIGFDPHTGLPAVLLAVVAVIVGGRGSFVGPVIGGLLLGFLRAEVVWYLSARWQEAVTFALLALVLLVRPYGLVGRQMRLEATA